MPFQSLTSFGLYLMGGLLLLEVTGILVIALVRENRDWRKIKESRGR